MGCDSTGAVLVVDPVEIINHKQSSLVAGVASSVVNDSGVDIVGSDGASRSICVAPGHKVDGKVVGSSNASKGGQSQDREFHLCATSGKTSVS